MFSDCYWSIHFGLKLFSIHDPVDIGLVHVSSLIRKDNAIAHLPWQVKVSNHAGSIVITIPKPNSSIALNQTHLHTARTPRWGIGLQTKSSHLVWLSPLQVYLSFHPSWSAHIHGAHPSSNFYYFSVTFRKCDPFRPVISYLADRKSHPFETNDPPCLMMNDLSFPRLWLICLPGILPFLAGKGWTRQ